MKISTIRKASLLQDTAQALGTSEVMELEKQKHHRHMEIIRAWDLCIYISCSFQIEVTWWVFSLTFALNLAFTQRQAQSRGHMLAALPL